MSQKNCCIWCGRQSGEVQSLLPGPVIHICNECVSRLADGLCGEEASLAAHVRDEIDRDLARGFQQMIRQINLGPLQDKYQRLMHVKFKEETGSPTFQEVFEEFKKGVAAEVADEDFQTRYDLAIAYHEMGLLDDALREMLQSLRGALRQKNFLRAGDVMSALLFFHPDPGLAIKGIGAVMKEAGL
jgi:hypothetical protein